jgi:hypothetical protein
VLHSRGDGERGRRREAGERAAGGGEEEGVARVRAGGRGWGGGGLRPGVGWWEGVPAKSLSGAFRKSNTLSGVLFFTQK